MNSAQKIRKIFLMVAVTCTICAGVVFVAAAASNESDTATPAVMPTETLAVPASNTTTPWTQGRPVAMPDMQIETTNDVVPNTTKNIGNAATNVTANGVGDGAANVTENVPMNYAGEGAENITANVTANGVIDILARAPDDTRCASTAFADALAQNADAVSIDTPEIAVREWIYKTFSGADVLRRVLACPEIAGAPDDASIKFQPIKYVFPGGRTVVTNYETQPKILKQRLNLATKRTVGALPASPRIGGANDDAEWSNTDPAWYAIMVVQRGALDEFIGDGKNYTISLDYIKQHINELFPKNAACTGDSALTNDNTMLNRAAHNMVNIKDDTNDYYVAGDVNLQWISYAEIALDVAITAATFGGGAAVLGATKAARASRILKNLTTEIRALSKIDSVRDYVRVSQSYARAAAELKKIDRAADAAGYTRKAREMENLAVKMRNLERTEENVRKYKNATQSFSEINKYRHALKGVRLVQRGNIATRAFRAFKAANTGNKMLRRGAKIARSGMQSGRIRDWLFQATLRNAGTLAKLEEAGGLVYGVINFAGGMYDWTETSTGEFTSGLEFAPLLLLSADDLQGQENVVNHGMWFMWLGNSTDPADDDAAYLLALDTAAKFYQDLTELQDAENSHPCDIDIFVVRPVIRNPGGSDAALYYLIMNDEPWSTGAAE